MTLPIPVSSISRTYLKNKKTADKLESMLYPWKEVSNHISEMYKTDGVIDEKESRAPTFHAVPN